MMKKLLLPLLLFFAAAGPAAAQAVIEREIACPVCGTEFYTKLDLAESQYEMRLDLRPVGIEAGPWRLPECPKCGFIIFKAGLGKQELARSRAMVNSADYKKILVRSTYYRAGLIYERLEKPPFAIANNFLKASWQEELYPELLAEDQELALRYFSDAIRLAKEHDEEWENANLMKGELLRRLGRFGPAAVHFEALKGMKEFKGNFLGDIVAYQLRLCSRQDSSPRTLQDVREFKMSPFARALLNARRFLDDLKSMIKK
ncbi:MAG: hypothetical protein A2179_03615 [Elusimicrobia bacterium GWC2_63_65]|nr:MAG: hypothetical protein A2179_03615 [Elusimicrobia bacterium GWC2_63_65]